MMNLGATLKRLRKTAGVSQTEMGKLLELHQTAICRIEQDVQKLTPYELYKISEHFKVGVDSILSGRINYWKLASDFGRKPNLSARYLAPRGSRVLELLPYISVMRNHVGEAKCLQILTELGLSDVVTTDPGQEIGIYALVDIIEKTYELVPDLQECMREAAKTARSEEFLGAFNTIYKLQTDPIRLVNLFLLSSEYFDPNFEYTSLVVNARQIKFNVRPKKHFSQIEFHNKDLKSIFCDLRKATLSQMPLTIGQVPLKIMESGCWYKGDHDCSYELQYA